MSTLLGTPSRSRPRSASSYFPYAYSEARERFCQLADTAHTHQESWKLSGSGPNGETLAIDVARWGSPDASRWLLLTTGLHGSEAPLGSAVLFKLLEELHDSDPHERVGIVLVHALNPYGYAWVRRTNEDNIDLNRNGLLASETYTGAHPLYCHVYHAFDPHRPRRLDSFYLQAWWLILRHSKAALQASLPVGQYEYPRGLFYGGKELAGSLQLLQKHLPTLMPHAEEVMHLDFHSGLGRWAKCKLLIDHPDDHTDARWLRSWAPPGTVESAANNRTAYHARGSLGPWLKQAVFPQAHYRYAAAEFGTYGSVAVLRSLVKELQAHYAFEPQQVQYERSKKLLRETFVPASPGWREQTLQQGVALCQLGVTALCNR